MAEIVRNYDPEKKVYINRGGLERLITGLLADTGSRKIIKVSAQAEFLTRGQIVDFCKQCDHLDEHGECPKTKKEQAKIVDIGFCMEAAVNGQSGWISREGFYNVPGLITGLIKHPIL
ncbi:MAG: hypothetical protein Q7R43_01345 [Candidatus Daviesbacteria bacterium]|nr:hypothetical protein [Candidatus Daviesbacteria bacterium]